MSTDPLQLHQDTLIFDAHRDVAYEAPLSERFLANWLLGVDLCLPLLRQGGIDAQVFAFCVAPAPGLPPTAEVLRELDMVMAVLDERPGEVALATSVADIRRAKGEGRLAILLSLEGAEPIMGELGLLRMFYRLGFRSIGLTWNFRNALADGAREGEQGGGLSRFGVAAVREMNRLGMMVDIAHLAPAGMRDVLRVSERPVVHSHGTCGALLPPPGRTPDDHMLEAIAANGGVFCVTTVPEALAENRADASLESYLDHVDHAVQVMGVEHVGLGADFDVYLSHLGLPPERWLRGLEEADRWPAVTAGLLARGYSEGDIHLIMGENLLRVYGEVMG